MRSRLRYHYKFVRTYPEHIPSEASFSTFSEISVSLFPSCIDKYMADGVFGTSAQRALHSILGRNFSRELQVDLGARASLIHAYWLQIIISFLWGVWVFFCSASEAIANRNGRQTPGITRSRLIVTLGCNDLLGGREELVSQSVSASVKWHVVRVRRSIEASNPSEPTECSGCMDRVALQYQPPKTTVWENFPN